MSFYIAILVFVGSLWVFGDATKKGARTPHGWALLSVLLFPIGFPLWLYKRRGMEPSSEQKTVSPWIMIPLMLAICFWQPIQFFRDGSLAKCDAADVTAVLEKMVGTSVSHQSQRKYDAWQEVRSCSAVVNGFVAHYNVSWYSDAKDQFVVNLE